ncbi:MAG: exodeoxyribonuclease V subunit gamma [Acidobacteria bacterium]|nr:exodeoxyribonuclease V subunit gamma [Acidobacteriota bacterium]
MAARGTGQLSLFGDGEFPSQRLNVYYSNRMETLARRLAGNIRSFRRERNLFATVTVLIPESSFETYLQFRLAEILGIAANIDFVYLDSFLDGLVASEKTRPLRRPLLEGLLLRLFLDDAALGAAALDAEDLSPLAAYLHSGSPATPARERRAVQLARRLASLFTEYGVSRPEMLERWAHPRFTAASPIEAWQVALFRRIFGPEGSLAKAAESLGQNLVPMPRQLRLARQLAGQLPGHVAGHVASELARESPLSRLPEEIHLFGFSYMARAYQDVLARLCRDTSIHFYALNPCREFWEDVSDRRPARKLARARLGGIDLLSESQADDPFDLGVSHESLALVLWGRPGREHIRMLNELTDCDFEPLWDDSPASEARTSLLSHLQREILERRSLPFRSRAEPDRSLVVLACPGPRREAEAIALEITKIVAAGDGQIRLNDVAVLIPSDSLAAYLPHLEAAFSEFHSIPFAVTGLDLASSGNLAGAALALLALPGGSFRRQDVISAVNHPAVLGRCPGLKPAEVAAWCEALGILYGASREDLDGTYVEADLFTWDQGIRRLVLGAFVDPVPDPDSAGVVMTDGRRLLPFPLPPGDVERAGELALLLRSLLNDARHLESLRLPLDEWASLISDFLATYLVPEGDIEEQERLSVLRAVRSIAESAVPGLTTGFATARDLATGRLGSQPSGRGQILARGVAVGPLMSLRALPFKVIFVAGLNGGSFPASEVRDPLDLRGRKRQPGDVTPRERDLYLFLEALLSARQRLVLSYVSQDPLTKEAAEPCSVIQELRFLIEQKQPGLYDTVILERVPEERSHGPTSVLPAALQREKAAISAGRQVRDRLGISGPLPRDLIGAFCGAARDVLDPLLAGPLVDAAPRQSDAPPRRLAFSIRHLQGFLECPLQAVAEALAGLSRDEESEEEALRSEEAFDTQSRDRTVLLRQAFFDGARKAAAGIPLPDALADAYDRHAWRLEAEGLHPTGTLGQAEREANLRVLDEWVTQVGKAGLPIPPRTEALAFGRASEDARVDRTFEGLSLAGIPLPGGTAVDVEVFGTLRSLLVSPPGSLVLAAVSRQSFRNKDRKYRDILRAFVEYAVLVAAGQAGGTEFQVVRAAASSRDEKGSNEVYRFRPWGQREAAGYLATLATEMLRGSHDDLFPYEAVMPQLLGKGDFEDAVEDLLANPRSASFTYGPIAGAESRPLPAPQEVARRIKVRFGPLTTIVMPPGGKWK